VGAAGGAQLASARLAITTEKRKKRMNFRLDMSFSSKGLELLWADTLAHRGCCNFAKRPNPSIQQPFVVATFVCVAAVSPPVCRVNSVAINHTPQAGRMVLLYIEFC
jgi:hypothetical protein